MNIARYKIQGTLDEMGAMGDVFLGHDTNTGNQVVIKFMKPLKDAASDHQARIRFDWEAKIALTVNHPHVLKAINHGEAEHDGHILPFLVYPYIQEGSLQKLMVETEPWKSWTLSQLADVIFQAAQGLHFLHTYNPPIVHQDVKPANFLLRKVQGLEPDRKVHLLLSDFGTARWQLEAPYQTNNVIGTPGYMAPEQAQGFIFTTIDQYALAVMTRYIFTGHPPRALGSQGIYTPLTELNPERLKSKEIDNVVLRALSREPEKRFPTVLDFAETLRAAVMRQQHSSFYEATTDPSPPVQQQQVSPTLPVQPSQKTTFNRIPGWQVPSYQPVDAPLSPALLPGKEVPRRTPSPLPTFPLRLLFRKELPSQPSMLSWSPDGTLLACTFHGQEAPWLVRMDEKVEIAQTLKGAHLACWSPAGRLLAMSTNNEMHRMTKICLWNVERSTERPVTLCSHNTLAIDGLDWSSNGQLAVWVEHQILLYTLPQQITSLHFPPLPCMLISEPHLHCGNPGTLLWSPDGSWLAAGASDGTLICWYTGDKQPYLHIPASGMRIYSLAWSTDSIWLAVAFENKRVVIWNMPEQREATFWENLPRMPQMLSISHQEHILVVATQRGLLFGQFGDTTPVAQHPGQMQVAWSPSGQELATLDAKSDTTIAVWQRIDSPKTSS